MTIEVRLRFQSLPGFRQVEQIPEGVRYGIEDHPACIHAGTEQCSMKIDSAALTMIAGRRYMSESTGSIRG
jgi:hypothetical protein